MSDITGSGFRVLGHGDSKGFDCLCPLSLSVKPTDTYSRSPKVGNPIASILKSNV